MKGYAAQNNFAGARAVFLAMQDPPVGVASLGNHPIDRHPKHHHQTGTSTSTQMPVDAPVYREPSTYEMMVKAELKAGEPRAAAEIVQMAEQRAFPPAGKPLLLFSFLSSLIKLTLWLNRCEKNSYRSITTTLD